ncbi:Sphingolipid long chain base-responsive protein PIL1 [Sphaceloma murrayae]|uniref:Sphingolipid long chain base-responsive protein PIL1 n=1 Tax=Sphaceloma murrayae TaxID=2082308 RepID=A0A2K1QGL7_9PEZI|nr:Sphingolipid long chain base-responsive protein PIL1 [Sphaceloma murrayae]
MASQQRNHPGTELQSIKTSAYKAPDVLGPPSRLDQQAESTNSSPTIGDPNRLHSSMTVDSGDPMGAITVSSIKSHHMQHHSSSSASRQDPSLSPSSSRSYHDSHNNDLVETHDDDDDEEYLVEDPLMNGADPYHVLSTKIASETLHSATIFRRFDRLTIRNLLYLESELLDLEDGLDRLDRLRYKETRITSWMQYWPLQEVDGLLGEVDVGQRMAERRDHVIKIRRALKEYHEALKLAGEIFDLQEPHEGDVKMMEQIVRPDMSLEAQALGSKGFYTNPFDWPMSDHLDKPHDLCILAPKVERDFLTKKIERKYFPSLYDEETGITNKKRYGNILLAVKLFSTSVAVLCLVSAIVALYFWRSNAGRLALFSILTLSFALFVALLTTAKTHDIYAATAAFAAVMVVFIGTALNQSNRDESLGPVALSRLKDGINTLATRTSAPTVILRLLRRKPSNMFCFRNRSLSIRSSSKKSDNTASKHRFGVASLRGIRQAELSKKLYTLIKTQNHSISAYEAAAKEQAHIASQLSDWGEETGDDSVSDISDKLGVLLAEIAEQEESFAQNLEDSRSVLKQIRNTESSVQPSRDHKAKISDEIAKLKYKEPSSTKIPQLEQELVRAEAQSLVAEAQLTNITRQKLKEAYDIHTAAVIERAEKQILLAKNARRLLELLDDTPVVPGDEARAFDKGEEAREVLNVAEQELREWTPTWSPIPSQADGLGSSAVPTQSSSIQTTPQGSRVGTGLEERVEEEKLEPTPVAA